MRTLNTGLVMRANAFLGHSMSTQPERVRVPGHTAPGTMLILTFLYRNYCVTDRQESIAKTQLRMRRPLQNFKTTDLCHKVKFECYVDLFQRRTWPFAPLQRFWQNKQGSNWVRHLYCARLMRAHPIEHQTSEPTPLVPAYGCAYWFACAPGSLIAMRT